MDNFRQRQVFGAIQRQPSSSIELAELLDLTPDAIQGALFGLRKKGVIEVDARIGRLVRYRVAPGATCPQKPDTGRHPNSRAALDKWRDITNATRAAQAAARRRREQQMPPMPKGDPLPKVQIRRVMSPSEAQSIPSLADMCGQLTR